MLIDTHVHLNLFANTPNSFSALTCIVPATTADKWQDIEALATSPTVFPAYGLHPWFAHAKADLDKLERIAPHGIAIGECGLDKGLSDVDFDTQLEFLHAQLAIAQANDLPVILHCVKASNELLRALKSYPALCGVVHGYSGSVEEAKRFLDLGFYFGISHVASNPNATRVHALFRALPISALLLESDAPNKRFVDANAYSAQFCQSVEATARHLNTDEVKLIAHSNDNARALFRV